MPEHPLAQPTTRLRDRPLPFRILCFSLKAILYFLLSVFSLMIVVFYIMDLIQNFFWSFAVLVAMLVLLRINYRLFIFVRRGLTGALEQIFFPVGDDVEIPAANRWLGPIGEYGGKSGRVLTRWKYPAAGLVLSGVILFLLFPRINWYFYGLRLHVYLGYPLFAAYLYVVYKFLVRNTRSKKVGWLFVACPIFYEASARTPTPLSIIFIYNMIIFPLFLLVNLMENVRPIERKDALAWFLWFICFTAALETGLYIAGDPTNLRFEFVQRYYHSFAGILTLLYLLYGVYYYYRRRRNQLPLSYRNAILVFAGIILVSFGSTLLIWTYKKHVIEQGYNANTYNSAPYNELHHTPKRLLDRPQRLAGSGECLKCHPLAYKQWAVSAHAYAAKNKAFQTVVQSLVERHGLAIARDCALCHDPAVALSGRTELLVDPRYVPHSEGVSCRVCHFMFNSEDKNGAYQIQIPRADLQFQEVPRRASFMVLAVLEHVSDFTKAHVVSGAGCFSCHSLRSKRHGETYTPLDNVTSFRQSSYARNDIIKCHDCHMPRIQRDKFSYSWRDHRMFGSQIFLDQVSYDASPQVREELARQAADNRAFIVSNLRIDEFVPAFMDYTFKTYRFFNYLNGWEKVRLIMSAVDTGPAFEIKPLRARRSAVDGGESLKLDLHFVNPALGHDFPSSLFANITRVWYRVSAQDAADRLVYYQGFQEDDLTNQLGRIEVDADHRPILPYESLDYDSIINLRFIKPDVGYFQTIDIPLKNAAWPLKIQVALFYKRYTDHQAAWMTGGQVNSFPAYRLAETEMLVQEDGSIQILKVPLYGVSGSFQIFPDRHSAGIY